MLYTTRSIYNQTFAGPGQSLLRKSARDCTEYLGGNTMLLVQPRKRSRATFDDKDHAISHPASWHTSAQDADVHSYRGGELSAAPTQRAEGAISRSAITALSLDQLQDLNVLVLERIEIKRRYNSTPLRRIISRQTDRSGAQIGARSDEDTASQTDTLVNTETAETLREPVEVRRRFNDTPLRRILSRQVGVEERDEAPRSRRYEPESLEIRKARYNNTPLRRIILRQVSAEGTESLQITSRQSSPVSQPQTPTPVPRSNTPLRRILSHQVSAQTAVKKEDDEVSERADSVIDPDSPVRSRVTASVPLNSEDRIRAYEIELWKFTTTTSPSPSSPSAKKPPLNPESHIRTYNASPTPKAEETVISVTELSGAKKPKRIVVDSKGSPLRRILQRQTSRDWRAPARVGVV